VDIRREITLCHATNYNDPRVPISATEKRREKEEIKEDESKSGGGQMEDEGGNAGVCI